MLDKPFDPREVEQNWYSFWEKNGFFSPQTSTHEPNRSSYCMMIPPPNVTGSLHMGHAFQETLMDVLVRFHRMQQYNTLWVVGTDHASIATQMMVERSLAKDNLTRQQIGRDEFLKRSWLWKDNSHARITKQMRKIGISVDWGRERFTLDEGFSDAVLETFIRLYHEGLIYKGKRLVNWDPSLQTAVSDLEVDNREEKGKLWYIRYPLSDKSGFITVATTRPETLLGDVAIAVHPEDPRFQSYIGKTALLPIANRPIPIIADDTVLSSFGTGAVKITPAHDFKDYAMGQKHKLPMINILTRQATLNENVPEPYRGLDRFVARKKILQELTDLELLEKEEPYTIGIPRGEKSDAILEPLLTDQWFIKIESLAKPALEAVEQGKIRFVPEHWNNTYYEWMRNIQDWCISRQLWWGHRIPAWYDEQGNVYVGKSESDVRNRYKLDSNCSLKQDEDVLDTWFSAALWPFATLGWPEKTNDFKTYYPTQALITGFDIIFFWIARMIMFGLKFTGEVPFKEVYITGLILGLDGQKMSKTRGNVIDPLDLIEGIDLESLVSKRLDGLVQPNLAKQIEKETRTQFPNGIEAFGTDALRFTFCAIATTARQLRFDIARLEGYRHFCNKIWNATRFVLMNIKNQPLSKPENFQRDLRLLPPLHRWILSRWEKTKETIASTLREYRFDLASYALYDFIWHEYCDWCLELTKPLLAEPSSEQNHIDNLKLEYANAMNQQGEATTLDHTQIASHTRFLLLFLLEEILRALHPFMPFITETLWQQVKLPLSLKGASIMEQGYPVLNSAMLDPSSEAEIEWLKTIIMCIRNIRSEMTISPKQTLTLLLQKGTEQDKSRLSSLELYIKTLCKIEAFEWLEPNVKKPFSATALVGELELSIPLSGLINKDLELERLQKEIAKLTKDLELTKAKLANPNFVERAPKTLVETEQKRIEELTQALEKITKRKAEFEVA